MVNFIFVPDHACLRGERKRANVLGMLFQNYSFKAVEAVWKLNRLVLMKFQITVPLYCNVFLPVSDLQ